ncbi:unnamed protein product [Phaedon cochleariae]|uniref:C2H2-type domain-containing protein n=1 Tax=Phaedon cochleariae TaxID=80249 RepID=A0A9P0DT47_PHACE|nr:unnamed protein product [Phaedon cochleariae]
MESITESELSDESSFSEGIYNQSSSSNKQKFKCHIDGCRKTFRRGWLLENHVRRHNGERPFICDNEKCMKSFTNYAHLKRHKSMVHDRSDELTCDNPGCGLVLSNKYSLKKHKNRMHQETNFEFSCVHCSQKFKKKRLLHEHLIEHAGPAPFRCERCNVEFYSQIKFTKHEKNHKTFICDCGDTFTKWTLFLQHRKQTCKIDISHKCVICQKVFSTQRNLTVHSMVHLEESQKTAFICHFPNCSKSYQYKKNLNAHITTFHKEQKGFVCQEPNCGAVYKYKKTLKQHIENVHGNGEKKVKKIKKARAPRKDQGKFKKSMAAILSGVDLTNEQHKMLVEAKKLESTVEIIEGKKTSETASREILEKKEELGNHSECSSKNIIIDIVIEPNKLSQNIPRDNIMSSSGDNLAMITKTLFSVEDHLGVEGDIVSELCDQALNNIQECLS